LSIAKFNFDRADGLVMSDTKTDTCDASTATVDSESGSNEESLADSKEIKL